MACTRLVMCVHLSECGSLGSVLGSSSDTGAWLRGLGAWLPAYKHAQNLFGAISEIPEQSMDLTLEDDGAKLFDRILDQKVIRLQQLVPEMVKFLECAEREVPHGCQPALTRDTRLASGKDHYLTIGGKINKNYAKHVLHQVRVEFQHEKRGRVANLAGWQMAGRRLLERAGIQAQLADALKKKPLEGEDYDAANAEADFDALGCRPPMIFHPLFHHAFEKPDKDSGITEPQVICYDGTVRLLIAFFSKRS